MQPIAIESIKYVTHVTQYRPGKRYSKPIARKVSYILPATGGSRSSISDNLDTDERENGLGIDLSGRYINSFSVLRGAFHPRRRNARNQLLWSTRCGFLRCFHFSGVALAKFLLFFFSLFFLSFFFIHRTLAKLYYQLLLSKFPTHLATGDAINLKKIINSNFSKTSGTFCFPLPLFLSRNPHARRKRVLSAHFFSPSLNICGA